MAAERPPHSRTLSTNLGGANSRILEGKLAIITGASRGMILNLSSRDIANVQQELEKPLLII